MSIDNYLLKIETVLKNKDYNTVSYVGCWSNDNITFMFENKVDNNTLSGYYVFYSKSKNTISFKRLSGICIFNNVSNRFFYPLITSNNIRT